MSEYIPNASGRVQGTITAQIMSPGGKSLQTYKYFQGSTTSGWTTDGWYVGNTKTRVCKENDNDRFFKAGEGVWLKGIANSKMTSSGKVPMEDVTLNLIVGQQMLVNPFPAPTSLTKIKIGYEGRLQGTITIQTLSVGGKSLKTYKYFQNSTTSGWTTDGWYIGNTKTRVTEDNDVPFEIGDGIWVKGIANSTITFEKPF